MDIRVFFSNGGIVTDTYPQPIFNEQQLLIYDFNGRLNMLAKIHSSFNNQGEFKCDLHPRYSSNLSKIAVDTSGRGKRKICVFSV